MARKQVDLKAAKAARQKKIAIGGAVLLVLVLVFQVPRTLKMLNPPAPKQSAAPAATTPTETTPTGTSPAPVTSSPVGTAVLTAQLAPAARQGQLSILSASFKSKDPFRQLIKDDAAPTSPSSAAPTKAPASKLKLKVVPSTPAPKAAPAAPNGPAAKKVVLPYLSASISVNGVKEGVNVTVDFPAAAPVFHLVSLTKKTAKISVAGGSLANGAPTLTLRRGKPLTLVNTADGTRYRLVLVSTSKDAATAPATSDPAAPGATTTTATTTTPTTTEPMTTTPTIGG
jgi:hypothetical protein